jgi:hypothetical protein
MIATFSFGNARHFDDVSASATRESCVRRSGRDSHGAEH